MKEEILNTITMEDVLNKYNIKYRHFMYHCPFHKDHNASAKMYNNSFYCFSCNKTGDVIQFVQYLFNLSFKEAMEKINQDFNLGLDSNTKIDYNKIKQRENEKNKKKLEKQKNQQEFNNLCDKKNNYMKEINKIDKQVNYNNWESLVALSSSIKMKCDIIDMRLDELNEKISNS